MDVSRVIVVLVLGLGVGAGCAPSQPVNDGAVPMDSALDVAADGHGGDAATTEDAGAMPSRTALTARFGATERALDRAQFGQESADGGATRIHMEAHAGGAPECPTMSSPTPDRTLVLAGLRVPAARMVLTEADGLVASLLDFRGDLLASPAPARARTVQLTVHEATLTPRESATLRLTLRATFDTGTIEGDIVAEHCDSLDGP